MSGLLLFISSIVISILAKHFQLWMIPVFVIGLPYFIIMVTKADKPKENWDDRRRLAMWDHARKQAVHAHERSSRYRDVVYDQYSVWVERQADEIVLSILKHSPPSKLLRFETGTPEAHWFRWYATKTKKGYAGEASGLADIRLTSPTFEKLQEQIAKMDESAAELERKSYLEGVRRAELDKLTFAARRPEGPARQVKKLKETDSERMLEHAIAREYQPSE